MSANSGARLPQHSRLPRMMLAAGLTLAGGALAQDATPPASVSTSTTAPAPAAACPARPAINFNRWSENWSVLAQPCVPRAPFDGLKYLPLSDDGLSYLSLGANLRERMEHNDAPSFGIGAGGHADTYVIERAEVHADLRLGPQWQAFVQLEDARPFHKDAVSPVDRDQLDLEQAFVTYVRRLDDGWFKARAGRQEMAFDLQRFIAVRDGPNVRQSFDALWADWETPHMRWIAYLTQPVQYRDASHFDDISNGHLSFNGLRVERNDIGGGDLSAYYSRYRRDGARFLDGQGDEGRNVFDVRYSGKTARFDWDVETMAQSGQVGARSIRAWALGSIIGYGWPQLAGKPRAGLQFDAASGDHHAGDGRVGTFNPLFPNGYYFSLAGYTGYANLIHLKPSLTLKPIAGLTLLAALGLQWRETTADAVYAQGSAVVPGTMGRGRRWTGAYAQTRADWSVNRNLTASVEAVHFQVGDTLRQAGGANADYVGVELKFGW